MQDDSIFLLGQIDGKLDQVIKNQGETNERILRTAEINSGRITSLEGDRAKILGAAGVISAIVTGAWQWFVGNK